MDNYHRISPSPHMHPYTSDGVHNKAADVDQIDAVLWSMHPKGKYTMQAK
jgi:hypothetical protein